MPRLIVVMAFDRDGEGELQPAFEPREMQSEEQARARARLLALDHAGVIAWARDAHPDTGDYGEPEVLFQSGDVPEME